MYAEPQSYFPVLTEPAASHVASPGAYDSERIHTIMRRKSPGMAEIRHMTALLKEAASLIPDYPAFETICADSLLHAWHSDRLTGKRELHNRRRAWMRLFRHFAPLHGIEKDIQIVALNRSGSYACELNPKRDRGQAWRDVVLRARQFGIYESELEGLAIRAEKRNASFKARSGAQSFASK